MSTRVDRFVRSLEMVKVESWMILYVNRRAQEKVSSRLKRKKPQFRTFCVDIFATHLKGRQHGS